MSDGDELVTLEASDGRIFRVPLKHAKLSVTISSLIEDAGVDNPIPLPNVSGPILGKVVQYLSYIFENPKPKKEGEQQQQQQEHNTDELTQWEIDFFKMDQESLFLIIMASNYMDIKPLLMGGAKTIANMIKGKTPDEIRTTFKVDKPFTAEEEELVRKENEWCNEDA